MVFSSHVVTELEQVCDHLLVLSRGRLRLAGPIAELLRAASAAGGVERLVRRTATWANH